MKHKKIKINVQNILSILCVLVSIYFIYNIYLFKNIETLIRYVFIAVILLFDFYILRRMMVKKKKKRESKNLKEEKKGSKTEKSRNPKKNNKKSSSVGYTVILVLVTFIYLFLSTNLNKIYSYFSHLNKDVVYSISLVTWKDTEEVDLKTLKGKKIGILSDTQDDGYQLAEEILKTEKMSQNNEILPYESYPALIMALASKEVNYIFLPTNYEDIYVTNEELEETVKQLKIVTTKEKIATKEEAKLLGSSKDLTEPFTILLIGIDSTIDGLKQADSFNGDSLMLVTFNPITMTATMLSIPRDTYVPIACFPGQYENKITHSASRGTSCVINTIQNFLDVKIDYYMKINFTGLVELVDALDGIEVDVPYSFCEQDSQRRIGEHTIYVKAGFQTLNGEEALAFSRNRKKNTDYCSAEWTQGYRDDFVRAKNQQTVVEAILDKMKSFTSVSKLEDILEVISNNLDTNMTEDTIFSFYNIAKDVMLSSSNDQVLSIQKLTISGYGQTIYDESTKLQLWNYVPNKKSVEEVKEAIQVNLGKKEHEMIKEFSYSIKDGYQEQVIGDGPYSVYTSYDLLVDFTKMSLTQAQSWASKYGVTLDIQYVNNASKQNGTIVSQNYPVNKRLDKIEGKKVTIQVVQNTESPVSPTEEKVDCLKNSQNKVCSLPNFVSKSRNDVMSWSIQFSNVVAIHFEYVESQEPEGTIISQSTKAGTTVKELIDKNTTITFQIAKKK